MSSQSNPLLTCDRVHSFHVIWEIRFGFVSEHDAMRMHRVDEHVQSLPCLLGKADVLEGKGWPILLVALPHLVVDVHLGGRLQDVEGVHIVIEEEVRIGQLL